MQPPAEPRLDLCIGVTAHRDLVAAEIPALERRLRELGATYYVLERWGKHGQYHRFQARMAVDGQADRVRHFEATHSDPQQAMANVLAQVESWRAGR